MNLTLPQIYERVASLSAGGYITNETRLNKGYIYSLIHSARAVIVCERWKQYGKIPPIYYQNYQPEYVKFAQSEGCSTIFYDTPPPIALDGRATGMGFVGANINGKYVAFREVSSKSAFVSMQNDPIKKAGRKAYVLVGYNTWEVFYKDRVKDFSADIITADPTTLPTYNMDYDPYPVDMGDIAKIELYIQQGAMQFILRTPVDKIADSNDKTANQPIHMGGRR